MQKVTSTSHYVVVWGSAFLNYVYYRIGLRSQRRIFAPAVAEKVSMDNPARVQGRCAWDRSEVLRSNAERAGRAVNEHRTCNLRVFSGCQRIEFGQGVHYHARFARTQNSLWSTRNSKGIYRLQLVTNVKLCRGSGTRSSLVYATHTLGTLYTYSIELVQLVSVIPRRLHHSRTPLGAQML